jgi:hypothetical protein
VIFQDGTMDDLHKVHLNAGWVLTGCGIAVIVVNAMNPTSLLCLAVGLGLLAYAKANPGKQ